MRINNPKSLAGFTLSGEFAQKAYELATVGQVNNAISKLRTDFIELIAGAPVDGTGSDNNSFYNQGLQGGFTYKKGYAWLGSDGKIDPNILPSLAITNVSVVSQNDLLGLVQGNIPDPSSTAEYIAFIEGTPIENLLQAWVNAEVTADADKEFMKGDIIIVTPTATHENTTTPIPDSQNTAIPAYAGTYIITDIQVDGADANHLLVTFAKMSYTNGNIVLINDVAPNNSTGQLTLYLRDILKTGTIKSGATATELEDVVYRLTKVYEDGKGYRFAFIDDAVGSEDENRVVKYAKLAELEEEATARAAADTDLANLIDTYNNSSIARDAELSGLIDNVNATLGSRDDTYAITNDDRALSATVFQQLRSLRQDIDHNAKILKNARIDTNALIAEAQSNINSIFDHLDGKAVAVVEKQFTWEHRETVNSIDDFAAIPIADVGTVKGYDVWTYTLSPVSSGSVTFNGKTYENNGNDTDSYERILAVFDNNGEKVDVDVKTSVENNKLYQTLTVTTNWYGENNNANANLAANPWTMLISKTIVGTTVATTNPAVGYNGSSSESEEASLAPLNN